MFLQKHNIHVILELVFIMLPPCLQIINVEILIYINYYNFQITMIAPMSHISYDPITTDLQSLYLTQSKITRTNFDFDIMSNVQKNYPMNYLQLKREGGSYLKNKISYLHRKLLK